VTHFAFDQFFGHALDVFHITLENPFCKNFICCSVRFETKDAD
jgi:hypothetical protein